jgi:hypothetical protein
VYLATCELFPPSFAHNLGFVVTVVFHPLGRYRLSWYYGWIVVAAQGKAVAQAIATNDFRGESRRE